MKTIKITLILLAYSVSCFSQTKKKDPVKAKTDTRKIDSTTVKKDNFLDMGAGTLTQIFGENLDGKSTGKTLSFLELLNKMDLPPEQKTEYKNQYYLQAKDLTEKQKDSLGKAIEKKIMEAKKTN
jgi:hypothetical protein